ncbi:MAG: winged helix-turn-helix domain-containing protein [Candidatus Thorarchaeota archaeon]
MTPMNGQDEMESDADIVLFEAISHPARIKMLFALREESLGFSELKRKVGISSSGNLQHHIRKLSSLVRTDSSGEYILTDQGQESIIAINAVRNIQNRYRNDSKVMTFVTTLAFYITYINIQFLLNPMSPLIPLQSVIATIVFVPIFYILYSWDIRRRYDNV